MGTWQRNYSHRLAESPPLVYREFPNSMRSSASSSSSHRFHPPHHQEPHHSAMPSEVEVIDLTSSPEPTPPRRTVLAHRTMVKKPVIPSSGDRRPLIKHESHQNHRMATPDPHFRDIILTVEDYALQVATIELCKISPALSRAVARLVVPESSFAQENLDDFPEELTLREGMVWQEDITSAGTSHSALGTLLAPDMEELETVLRKTRTKVNAEILIHLAKLSAPLLLSMTYCLSPVSHTAQMHLKRHNLPCYVADSVEAFDEMKQRLRRLRDLLPGQQASRHRATPASRGIKREATPAPLASTRRGNNRADTPGPSNSSRLGIKRELSPGISGNSYREFKRGRTAESMDSPNTYGRSRSRSSSVSSLDSVDLWRLARKKIKAEGVKQEPQAGKKISRYVLE